MIGRLVLSSRNLYKIPKNNKLVSARKCNILSENLNDMLIQTNKEFNPKDSYIKINMENETVEEFLGTVGDPEDDINIYHYLYTLSWISNKKYNDLWKKYNFNSDFDIINTLGLTRENYTNQVITIDPLGSIDLDDGYSFSADSEFFNLDIHIADPISYFDFSKPEMIELFGEFVNRINTCYIPNTKGSGHAIHLLPDFVVKYVSLLELNKQTENESTNESDNEIKFRRGMSFCFKINRLTNQVEFELKHTKLYNLVNKTYEQFDEEINTNPEQKNLLVQMCNFMIGTGGFRLRNLDVSTDISHQMIEVFMIWVNLYAGKYLQSLSSQMITRVQDSSDVPENLSLIPDYCVNFLNHSANYKISSADTTNLHYSLGISNYCHASSPMRRVIDMMNHLLIYKTISMTEQILNQIDIDKMNLKMKNQKKISNAYDLICYLKKSNRFKAFILDLKIFEERTFGLLIVRAEPDFKKMINVELPKNVEGLEKYKEIDVEIYYSSVNFKTSKFPFSVKIL